MCFQKGGKNAQASRCINSRIMTKVIDYVLYIDTFEKQCVVLKCMFQSPPLNGHVQTIGIDQYLSNNTIYVNTNVLKTSKNYTNKLVSVTTSNNSNIFLRMIWFLLLKDSPKTVLYIPWHQYQWRNHVLQNHCVCLITFDMYKNCYSSSWTC